MESTNQHLFTSLRLKLLAASEWLMVLPATVFLAAAALRMLQPRQYQPARLSWAIFEWSSSHMSGLGFSVLLIALPAMVLIMGTSVLLKTWREDQELRQDISAAWVIVRRRLAIGILTAATLLGGGILVAVMVHMINN